VGNMYKIKQICSSCGVVLITFCIIITVSFAYVFIKDQSFSLTENRNLQQFPNLTMQQFADKTYQDQLEAYASDQFMNRSFWMKAKTHLEYQFGKREFNNVYIGKDEMLFQKSESLTQTAEDQLTTSINHFIKKYDKIHFSMLLIPDKAAIYPEQLPKNAPKSHQLIDIKKLTKQFDKRLHYIDCQETLLSNKEKYLYYRSDHHWTSEGAYLVFQTYKKEILKNKKNIAYDIYAINNTFLGTLTNQSGYEIKNKDIVNVYLPSTNDIDTIVYYIEEKEKHVDVYQKEKAISSNPYEVFLGGNHPLIHISTTASNHAKLLILKDSYANCFIPFLLPYYSEIIVVDPRYYYDDLHALIKENQITDILFLYSANTLFKDTALKEVLMEASFK